MLRLRTIGAGRIKVQVMQLDLDDEQKLALLNLLTETIGADRYPVSLRVQVLRAILAKFGPFGSAPPAQPGPTPEERDPRRRPRAQQRRW
jgi:hypothetical protein